MISLTDIIKKENIISVSPEDHLSYALSKLSTSHDALFVFEDVERPSEKKKFLGIINPYHCLIKSSYPGNTKVKHCLVHPPKIFTDYSLFKVINLLIQSKIHYLPVFENIKRPEEKERFLGVISARRVLSHLKNLPIYKDKIELLIKSKKRPLLVIYEEDSIAKALDIFRKTQISKLIVINQEMKLKGVLSYYDLISFLGSPDRRQERSGRQGNKIHLYSQKVKNFMKNYVLTLSQEKPLFQAFNLILEKKIGSVIIIDEEHHPIGVITTRDLFQYFLSKEGGLFKQVTTKFRKIFK